MADYVVVPLRQHQLLATFNRHVMKFSGSVKKQEPKPAVVDKEVTLMLAASDEARAREIMRLAHTWPIKLARIQEKLQPAVAKRAKLRAKFMKKCRAMLKILDKAVTSPRPAVRKKGQKAREQFQKALDNNMIEKAPEARLDAVMFKLEEERVKAMNKTMRLLEIIG